jgi:hypothetical protein
MIDPVESPAKDLKAQRLFIHFLLRAVIAPKHPAMIEFSIHVEVLAGSAITTYADALRIHDTTRLHIRCDH